MEESKKLSTRDVLTLAGLAIVVAALFFFGSGVHTNIESAASKGANVQEMMAACKGQNSETCYAKAFEKLTTATDMTYAFTTLRELEKIDPAARGCHFIAHSISSAQTRKDPSKWKEIMNSAPQDCSYGAAHGALEVYASTFPGGKLPASEVPMLCNNPDTNNCTHILGHLLLITNENEIDKAATLCESLPHNADGKFECLTGVFMERQTAFNLVEHGLATKDALNWPKRLPELTALCRAQTGTRSVACWKEIVHVALVTFNNDPQKMVDFCETAPGEGATRRCIDHSLGVMAGSYNFEIANMRPICEARVKATDFKSRCYAHLVSATLSTVPQEIPAAVKFCGTISLEYQEACFTMIGNALSMARPEYKATLTQACQAAPESYRKACAVGGNGTSTFNAGT